MRIITELNETERMPPGIRASTEPNPVETPGRWISFRGAHSGYRRGTSIPTGGVGVREG